MDKLPNDVIDKILSYLIMFCYSIKSMYYKIGDQIYRFKTIIITTDEDIYLNHLYENVKITSHKARIRIGPNFKCNNYNCYSMVYGDKEKICNDIYSIEHDKPDIITTLSNKKNLIDYNNKYEHIYLNKSYMTKIININIEILYIYNLDVKQLDIENIDAIFLVMQYKEDYKQPIITLKNSSLIHARFINLNVKLYENNDIQTMYMYNSSLSIEDDKNKINGLFVEKNIDINIKKKFIINALVVSHGTVKINMNNSDIFINIIYLAKKINWIFYGCNNNKVLTKYYYEKKQKIIPDNKTIEII